MDDFREVLICKLVDLHVKSYRKAHSTYTTEALTERIQDIARYEQLKELAKAIDLDGEICKEFTKRAKTRIKRTEMVI